MRTRKRDHDLVFTWLAPVALAGLLSACGGGDGGGGGGSETPAGGAGAAAPPPVAGDTTPAGGPGGDAGAATTTSADTGAAAAGRGASGGAGGGGAGGDAKLIALGDSVFHGQAGGGTCYVCHGQDAKGSGVGPNLTDSEWLNTDGTLAGITTTIKSGVPQPKKAPAPMPPMGGASLSADQVKAVATYVHSLGGGK
jgi:mono/diheme cytochrome c family protein